MRRFRVEPEKGTPYTVPLGPVKAPGECYVAIHFGLLLTIFSQIFENEGLAKT